MFVVHRLLHDQTVHTLPAPLPIPLGPTVLWPGTERWKLSLTTQCSKFHHFIIMMVHLAAEDR